MSWFSADERLKRRNYNLIKLNQGLSLDLHEAYEENDRLRVKLARQAEVINALRRVFDYFGFDVNIEDVNIPHREDD